MLSFEEKSDYTGPKGTELNQPLRADVALCNPIQRSRAKQSHADEGAALYESQLGRVCGTAACDCLAREAEGQVEGGLSFASFSGCRLENSTFALKENEEKTTRKKPEPQG